MCTVTATLRVKAWCMRRTREGGESPWRHNSACARKEVPTEVYLKRTCKNSLLLICSRDGGCQGTKAPSIPRRIPAHLLASHSLPAILARSLVYGHHQSGSGGPRSRCCVLERAGGISHEGALVRLQAKPSEAWRLDLLTASIPWSGPGRCTSMSPGTTPHCATTSDLPTRGQSVGRESMLRIP